MLRGRVLERRELHRECSPHQKEELERKSDSLWRLYRARDRSLLLWSQQVKEASEACVKGKIRPNAASLDGVKLLQSNLIASQDSAQNS